MYRIETILLAIALVFVPSSLAADLETQKAECDSCHGPLGVSPHEDVPTIGGQAPEFLVKSMKGYQYWDRPCIKTTYRDGPKAGSKTDMCKIASALGEENVNALSEWYGSQAFVPATQAFDETLAQAGKLLHEANCEKCHAGGGALPGKAPRLAGQWMTYLVKALDYVPTGERLCPSLMERGVNKVSEDELRQLLHYYASQQD